MFLKGGNRQAVRSDCTVLLYCLRGVFNLNVEGRSVSLKEREMLIVNTGEEYQWESKLDSLLLRVSIDNYVLRQSLNRAAFYFELSSIEHTTRDYNSIRMILDSIVKRAAESIDSFEIKSLYYMLWQDVCQDYLVDARAMDADDEEVILFKEVEAFIYENFAEPLSLKQMADRYHVTESKFSRWFKKYSGEKFVDYLRRIRLEYASHQLLTSDMSITDIAFQAGFLNLSVFNRNFLEKYGIQPSKYRHSKISEDENAADNEFVNTYLKDNSIYEKRTFIDEKNIKIDVNQMQTLRRNTLDVFGPVSAELLQDGQMQKDISSLIKDLHIQYMVVSNLLELEYEKICRTIDFLLIRLNLIPVLEVSESANWKEVLEYLILRFTRETLSKCLFKINYEPGMSPEDFTEKYIDVYRVIKSVLPKTTIGFGGMWMLRDSQAFLQFVENTKSTEYAPDFVSIMCPPYSTANMKKSNFVGDRHYVKNNLDMCQDILTKINFTAPIWIEGWDSAFVIGDSYNDSCVRACHSLMQISDVAVSVEHICYGRISDWSYLSNDYPYPLFGAGGLISKDGIKKPIYYALLMNSFTGDYCLAKGEGYYVTKTADGYYCILLYNDKKFNPIYFQSEELRPEMMSYISENQNSLEFRLQLNNIECGHYDVASYEIRSDQNNILAEWKNLGYKSMLNPGEIDYLNAVCNPKLTYQYENVINGILSLKYVLGPNDFRMLLFMPQ